MQTTQIGIIGLAVMGRSLALNMADHGFIVGGYNRSREVTETLIKEHPHKNLIPFYDLKELVESQERPRKFLIMVKAGKPVDMVIDQLIPLLDEGDMILDGGNSFFEDTRRREKSLKEKGIYYFGTGVSGGEMGARFGPSIMPGGEKEAYEHIAPILEAISAKAQGEPCCAYMGPDGAGHYVKMVHNGIEYADMQLIAEAYLLLKYAGGFTNQELADIFTKWNEGELKSYLIGITAGIFREKDDFADGELVDYILDSAGQKGTGRWTSLESLKQGVNVSMITAACNARIMSNRVAGRKEAKELIESPKQRLVWDKTKFQEKVRKGLYTAKIVAYAQGFDLLSHASAEYGWNLDYGKIASIFRAGCIIQAEFLDDITRAFEKNRDLKNLMMDSFFRDKINMGQESLRDILGPGIQNGIPVPAMSQAVAYIDAFRGTPVGANLIQAQRDCFGAHTYERTDREGIFHHDWRFEHE
ncbi:NADP-dependent phosphogluconate dehydrogenase [[Clostridium] symbiosum]|uniref:NADP-dependent phosphogluconate dehydrogenase n=1 Tax=Clostridium symbiosum TaxID=1512 RepID=UPI001D092B6D|nr:NADP-dependent phosphogluconate dehydrogenase [[Clostridium] symbiosum]MCB6608513.1 NADP-dependent phosphogluconate dehydrogenase [[Clostridium] symbiosum]MCB6932175.1 NADP-dependent phosphogluconate dehydrogenase [[Clostridium] symbiosum]